MHLPGGLVESNKAWIPVIFEYHRHSSSGPLDMTKVERKAASLLTVDFQFFQVIFQ